VTDIRFAVVIAALTWGSVAAQNAPFTLQAALEALPKSPAWQAADRNVDIARRSLEAARGAALSISVGGDATRNGVASIATPELNGVQYSGSLGAAATLAVAPWSPVFDAVRASERALKRAELDRLEAHAGLSLDALNRYFEARAAQRSDELSQAFARLQEARLSVAQRQLELRTGTLEGVKGAEAALEAARAAASAAAMNAMASRRALLLGLGVPDRAGLTFTTPPVPRALSSLESFQATLPSNLPKRADVQRAALGEQEAQDALLIAQRDRLMPQGSLNVGVGGSSATGQPSGAQANASFNLPNGTLSLNTGYNFATVAATQLTLSLSFSVPIVAPANDARVRAAASALETARLNTHSIRANAEVDALRAYVGADAAMAQTRVAQSNLALAQQRATDAERRVQLGLSTDLERDGARLNATQAERDLETAQANALIAVLRLEVALGNTNLISLLNGAKL
jgi:outer membrane protein